MKSKRRKSFLVIMAIISILGYQMLPAAMGFGIEPVYASKLATAKLVNSVSVTQGDQNVIVTVEVQNFHKDPLVFNNAVLSIDNQKDISISGGTNAKTSIEKDQTTTISFYLNVNRYADLGTRNFNIALKNEGTVVFEEYKIGKMTIFQKISTPESGTGNYVAAMDIVHATSPTDGFSSGTGNKLALEIFNNGNTMIKNAALSLTLPDGLSIYNSSNSENLGYIPIGSSKEVTFPIEVANEAVSKNYAITAELTGLNYSDAAVSLKKTFYIPVNGAGSSVKNVAIANINAPDQVLGDDEFNLSFQVQNLNNAELKNIKVAVDVPEGLLNKSRIAFVESSIPARGTKDYNIKLFASDGSKEKAYPIKISVSPSSSDAAADTVIQYASVYVKAESGNSKTPQLMVDTYDFGGSFVQAGDEFLLDIGLYNTSKTHNLTNIKVTLTSEDGTFVPVGSSNSFYIDEIGKKKHDKESVVLAVKPNAEQKTTALTVDMSYEDGAGNAFTAKDIISIPIMQDTRLEVDDIIAPPDLFAFMQTGVSVQFYNTGKTVLSNLRVTAEGNFDTTESVSYFVGNLESGKSDSYDFSFIPREAGPMEGKIIFSYEDASGEVQTLEKPFSFQVMEEMPMPDEGDMIPEDGGAGKSKLPLIIGSIAVLASGGAGFFFWKKHKKKKINQEMEIDE